MSARGNTSILTPLVLRGGAGIVALSVALFALAPLAGRAQPQGGHMIFWSRRGEAYGVYMLDIGRSLLRQIATPPETTIVDAPGVSPDGRHVVYERVSGPDLQISIHEAGRGALYHTGAGYEDRLPGWSPDGGQIAFWSNRTGGWNIYVMDADGSNLRQYTNEGGFLPYAHPMWSPDGRRIAFRFARPRTVSGLFIVDVVAGSVRNVRDVVGAGADLAWSPDGEQIAFRSDWDRNAEIYALDLAQDELRNLSNHPAVDFQPAWSPDGRRIAFVSTRGGSGIYVMNTDGSDVHSLNTGGGWLPVWSPDGEQIAFVSNRDGNDAIYVIDDDGSNLRRIAEVSYRNVFLSWYAGRGG